MSKGKIIINLSDADMNRLKAAVHGFDFWNVLWDIDQQLRSYVRHGGHNFKTATEAFEHTRDLIRDLLGNRGINLEIIS